ncbi:MAG: hypothetical protein GY807_12535 [Gammaproteobacteria bacterium]|nr:hypothetical protein [Gammaproteobacteria bacterium]
MLRNPTGVLVPEAPHLKSTVNSNRFLRRLIPAICLAAAVLFTGIGIFDKTNDTGYQGQWIEIDHKPNTQLFIGVF